MKKLTEQEIHDLGQDAATRLARRGVEGLERTQLLRLKAAIDNGQTATLANTLASTYESVRGLDPADVIGKLVTRDQQNNALTAMILVLQEYFDAIAGNYIEVADPLAANPHMEIKDENIEQIMGAIGQTIKNDLPEGWGFMLNIFTFGPNGATFYISNAQRADMISNMRELIEKLERGEA